MKLILTMSAVVASMTFESFEKILHLIADVITILGVGGLVSFAALARNRNLLGRKFFNCLIWIFKFGLILAVIIVMWQLWMPLYGLVLIMLKGEAIQFYWEDGKEFQHIIAYLVTVPLMLSLYGLIGLTIATASLYYPKLVLNKITNGSISLTAYTDFNVLQIVEATYGSAAHRADVTHVLRSMVESGRLRVLASNSLAGDPDVGKGKTLRVKYRINDVQHQTEVQEGRTLTLPEDH